MKGRAHQRRTGVTQGTFPRQRPSHSPAAEHLMCLLLEMIGPWSCPSQWGLSPTLGCSARKSMKSRAGGFAWWVPSRLEPWKEKQCFPLNVPFHVCILLNKNDFLLQLITSVYIGSWYFQAEKHQLPAPSFPVPPPHPRPPFSLSVYLAPGFRFPSKRLQQLLLSLFFPI